MNQHNMSVKINSSLYMHLHKNGVAAGGFMFKKYIIIFLVIIFSISIIGCAQKTSNEDVKLAKSAVDLAEQYLNEEISFDDTLSRIEQIIIGDINYAELEESITKAELKKAAKGTRLALLIVELKNVILLHNPNTTEIKTNNA